MEQPITTGIIEKGSLAAFLVCAMATLLLFACCCHPSDEESSLRRGGEGIGYSSESYDSIGSSKSLFGAFGAFSACASMSRSGSLESSPLPRLWYTYAMLGGLSGALGEALPLGVDDNLSMPLVSGVIFLALSRCIPCGPGLSLEGGMQK